MTDNDFLAVEDHFDRLVEGLNARDLKAYRQCKHTRPEAAYVGRNFLVYTMINGEPQELDRLIVDDFNANGEHGASTIIVSTKTSRTIEVGYTPVRLLDYPAFVFIPLHSRLRWGASEKSLHKGTLAFPVVVRTRSRFNLREEGVTYVETGRSFGEEFDTPCAE